MENDYGPRPYMDQDKYNIMKHIPEFYRRDPIDTLQECYKICPVCGLKTARWDRQCVACHTTLC